MRFISKIKKIFKKSEINKIRTGALVCDCDKCSNKN